MKTEWICGQNELDKRGLSRDNTRTALTSKDHRYNRYQAEAAENVLFKTASASKLYLEEVN